MRGEYYLTAPQSEVDAVLIAHQVLVSARLGHPALVHHQDLVTVHHGAQSGQNCFIFESYFSFPEEI